ncbi:MAG: peptide deformylase [Bacteroidales bacterium]|nr:peptide deformylase [Bacteroidales bacterium]
MKAIRFLLPVLAVALLSCGGPRKAQGPFEAWERSLIEQSDTVMYVGVVTDAADSVILRTPCRTLSEQELRSGLYRTLASKMVATVRSPQQGGVGIAAPQVGLSLRLAVIQRIDRPDEPYVVYPNIRVLEHLGDTVRGPEGCLSIPGKRGVVPRSEGVIIGWTDPETLEERTEELHGYVAIIFQHETDHLDGILYTDRADSVDDDPEWEAERAPYAMQGAYVKPAWRCRLQTPARD